jgi:hypothetical protein
MVRISITEQAFLAIASTLALGRVGFEDPVNENGERLISNGLPWIASAPLEDPARAIATSFFGWWWRSVNGQSG